MKSLRLLERAASLAQLKSQASRLKTASSCSFQGRTVTPINEVKEINMKSSKILSAAVVLTFVFSLSAFAGETHAPPCAPGETQAPPCAATLLSADESTAPGETDTPPASNTVDILSVVDAAMNLLLFF
jgi:hypothetical protein